MFGQRLVHQAQRMRKFLTGKDFQPAVDIPAGEVRGPLPPPVEHQHRTAAVRGGQRGRRGMRDVMRNELDLLRGPNPAARVAMKPGAFCA